MVDPRLSDADGADAQSALVQRLVDGLPAMVAYWSADLRCRFANRAYEKWFGVSPESMIGVDMRDFLGPLFALNEPYIEGVLRGEEQEFEREIPDPAGGPARHSQAHYIPDVVDGTVKGFCVLVVDITRRKHAEEALQNIERQLQATERLASTATLAAGIAHELNNPLASVLANIELTLESIEQGDLDPESMKHALVLARDGSRRMRDIVQSIKLLARGDVTKREIVDLNETVERSIVVAANVIRYRARLVSELHDVGSVDGNTSQLTQLFVNLLMNAAQALPEENVARNEIRVCTRREGASIVVEVADNGCGIPEEMQARIFEPFFTTRDVGAGMGLGLSVSSGIVSSLGGTISVKSKVGEGSVFRVMLPAAAQRLVEAKTRMQQPDQRSMQSVKRPRVLVVDDDVAVARTLGRILAAECDVTVLNRGRDAITTLSADSAGFDLIFCDLMMPEVTGADVYAEVTRVRPELAPRFVFITGGAFTPRGQKFLDSVHAPVLEKPFDIDRIRALVSARP
ncbi:MAG: ATP-binding protein [Polyangiales bacterium]